MRNKILATLTMTVLGIVAMAASTSAQSGSVRRARSARAYGTQGTRADSRIRKGTRRGRAQTQELRNRSNAGPLSADDQWALNEAIQDEYKARAIYAKVIEKFGEIRPFSNIIHAESRHVDALAGLYQKYGLQVPKDNWRDKVPVFATPPDACAAAIQAEIENAALYDRIMTKINKPDLTRVFTALRDASLNNHLPAFKRCLEQGGGPGQVQGGTRRQGQSSTRGRGRGGSGRGIGFRRGRGGRGWGSR